MNKIVDKLRDFYQTFETDDYYNPIYYEAADEIERLQLEKDYWKQLWLDEQKLWLDTIPD